MTSALIIYSAIFMRYSVAVSPKNYLLFGCHFVNECAQLTQGYRFLHYWKYVLHVPTTAVGLSPSRLVLSSTCTPQRSDADHNPAVI